MATAAQIVDRALRKIGVVASDTAATADESANGLEALNMMLAAWKLAGVDISHTALAAGDTFPLADEYEEGTVYLLASRIAPDYEVPQAFDADDWFRKIQAAYTSITAATIPTSLTRMPSQFQRAGRYRFSG